MVNNQTDELIITKILEGDSAAYSALVTKYSNMVFTLAYNIILSREDAEEVAQDAFLKAFTALSTFKKQSTFSTWLYRIVVNVALNKKKLKRFITADIDEEITTDEDYNIYPLMQQYESRDQKRFIQLAMSSLREDERVCIAMFYLNELSVSAIHELTKISIANIKVLLHRGRKHLYAQLNNLLKTEIKNLM
jgi:RNA polymerase sigma factor (sigma-70 family)